jgi:isopentenyldiphosphate isomerase
VSLNELFDVFNEQMIKIGKSSRQNVHTQGLWHQTFHCWIVDKSTRGGWSLLFQLRHKDKDTYPNLLDISCAGHLLSGETVEDGVRELQEELGISVPINKLIYCGIVPQENIISNKLIDREFNHLFIYECNKPLNEYNFQISEISGLFFVNIREFQQLLIAYKDFILVEGIVFDEMEEKLFSVNREICKSDIAPNSNKYYELLFDKIQTLME